MPQAVWQNGATTLLSTLGAATRLGAGAITDSNDKGVIAGSSSFDNTSDVDATTWDAPATPHDLASLSNGACCWGRSRSRNVSLQS
jgi:hypothetical protein